jgi:hypothetical protein
MLLFYETTRQLPPPELTPEVGLTPQRSADFYPPGTGVQPSSTDVVAQPAVPEPVAPPPEPPPGPPADPSIYLQGGEAATAGALGRTMKDLVNRLPSFNFLPGPMQGQGPPVPGGGVQWNPFATPAPAAPAPPPPAPSAAVAPPAAPAPPVAPPAAAPTAAAPTAAAAKRLVKGSRFRDTRTGKWYVVLGENLDGTLQTDEVSGPVKQ